MSKCLRQPTRLLSAALLITVLMNATASYSADVPGHRLAGSVWVGPSCAGAQREGALCRAPLVGVEVRLSETGGRVAATATTDATGAFTMTAPAGRYLLHVVSVARVPRCPDLAVTLPLAQPATVELECDSGMR